MRQTPVPISTGMVTSLMFLLRLIVQQAASHLFFTDKRGRTELYTAFNWVVKEFASGWSNNSEQERQKFYDRHKINGVE